MPFFIFSVSLVCFCWFSIFSLHCYYFIFSLLIFSLLAILYYIFDASSDLMLHISYYLLMHRFLIFSFRFLLPGFISIYIDFLLLLFFFSAFFFFFFTFSASLLFHAFSRQIVSHWYFDSFTFFLFIFFHFHTYFIHFFFFHFSWYSILFLILSFLLFIVWRYFFSLIFISIVGHFIFRFIILFSYCCFPLLQSLFFSFFMLFDTAFHAASSYFSYFFASLSSFSSISFSLWFRYFFFDIVIIFSFSDYFLYSSADCHFFLISFAHFMFALLSLVSFSLHTSVYWYALFFHKAEEFTGAAFQHYQPREFASQPLKARFILGDSFHDYWIMLFIFRFHYLYIIDFIY